MKKKMGASDSNRVAIVCMVRDSREYLPEFIAYHEKLVDHIFFIDHRSNKDLRALSLPGISVFRSNHRMFFQPECVNTTIRHLKIWQDFSWLYLLDIDEFLPFRNRNEVACFAERNTRKSCVSFHWKNGFGANPSKRRPEGLIDYADFLFFERNSPVLKSCVNLSKTRGNFLVPSGAHSIRYMRPPWHLRTKRLKRRLIIPSHAADVPLYHIPAFSREHLTKKMANVTEHRRRVKGRGDWVLSEYPEDFAAIDEEKWRKLVANFRVHKSAGHFEVGPNDFQRKSIFDRIDKKRCSALRRMIDELPNVMPEEVSIEESKYLAWKTDETDILGNLAWFQVSDRNEIICVDAIG